MFAEILKSVESETALVLEENAYLGKRRKRTWEKGGSVPGEKEGSVPGKVEEAYLGQRMLG